MTRERKKVLWRKAKSKTQRVQVIPKPIFTPISQISFRMRGLQMLLQDGLPPPFHKPIYIRTTLPVQLA